MSYCVKCGTQLADNAAFCPSCGTKNRAYVAPERQQYQQGQYQQYQQPYQQYQQPYQQYQQPYRQIEQVSMITALTKYAQFSGRARRSEYWLWTLFTVLVNFACNIVCIFCCSIDIEFGLVMNTLLPTIIGLAFFLPGLAVFVRRMHDTGHSGWNWFWVLLPIIGWVILLIYLCQDSQPGENQYGPNPKGF